MDTDAPGADRAGGAPRAGLAPLPSQGELSRLSPAYFALVMATGFVSIAAFLLGIPVVPTALLWLNVVAYPVLWVFTVLRAIRYRDLFVRDLTDHQLAPAFFTVAAGTCVLGTQLLVIAGAFQVATALWVWGITLWVLLTYGIFTALIVKENKPPLEEGITGAWLIAVVATQSVAVLSALLAAHVDQPRRLEMNFFALSMWLWGGMLYIWMISLIFYRYTFFKFSPADLTPPYWINMGAMAISTLAGSLLIINAPDAPFLRSLLPFLKGFTVFYWATGTWWIPMLVILAFWRYAYRRFPLAYDPLYWGAVFPLAVYTVATFRMAEAMQLDFLYPVPRTFVWVALGAWVLAFVALLRWMAARAGLASGVSS
jgi:tellurite resistance protein TehA-like permease